MIAMTTNSSTSVNAARFVGVNAARFASVNAARFACRGMFESSLLRLAPQRLARWKLEGFRPPAVSQTYSPTIITNSWRFCLAYQKNLRLAAPNRTERGPDSGPLGRHQMPAAWHSTTQTIAWTSRVGTRQIGKTFRTTDALSKRDPRRISPGQASTSTKSLPDLRLRVASEGISVVESIQRFSRRGTVVRTKVPIPVVEPDSLLDRELIEASLLPADFARADIEADRDCWRSTRVGA